VVLIGHSKGGVDIADLLATQPGLHQHVRAVVSMQAPYGGTPIASDLTSNPTLISAVGGVIRRVLHGDLAALTDLTYAARHRAVNAENYRYPRDIATVSLTGDYRGTGPMTPGTEYMRRQHGVRSDGMVPTEDQILPGSDVVRTGMDHAGPAIDLNPFDRDVPGDTIQALLTLALERANEMEQQGQPAGGQGGGQARR
jgi:hypothetical protein